MGNLGKSQTSSEFREYGTNEFFLEKSANDFWLDIWQNMLLIKAKMSGIEKQLWEDGCEDEFFSYNNTEFKVY